MEGVGVGLRRRAWLLIVALAAWALATVVPASALAAEPRAGIVAQGSGSAGTDAQLRARIGSLLRERGFDVVPPAELKQALGGAGAFQTGRVANDAARLESARSSAGAQLLVFADVQPGPEGKLVVTVLVLTEGRQKERRSETTPDSLESTVVDSVAQLAPMAPADPAAAARGAGSLSTGAAPASSAGDLVILHDGTRMVGRVLRQEPGQFVIIVDQSGRQQTVAWTDVQRVVLAQPPAQPSGTTAQIGPTGFSVGGRLEDAEAKRQAWLKRGGTLASYEVRASGIFMLFPKRSQPDPVVFCLNASGVPTAITTSGGEPPPDFGGGGGVGGRLGLFFLKPPAPDKGSTWFAARFSSGLDVTYMGIDFHPGIEQPSPWIRCSDLAGRDLQWQHETYSMTFLNVPFTLGVHLGLGSMATDGWGGVVLGLAYSPAFTYALPSEGEGQGNFNYLGFEGTLDFTSMRATMEKHTQEAHFRIAGFLLPPVDDLPLVATLSLGAVWY